MAGAGGPSKRTALFVCLGNICRSPIAEGVFLQLIRDRGEEDRWTVDSCGTIDYHSGKSPDHRAMKVMKEKGIQYTNRARVIRKEDFNKFEYIFAMDEDNVDDLERMKPGGCTSKIVRLGEFDKKKGKVLDVRDPYYDTGDKGFYDCYDQCLKACEGFLKHLEDEISV